MKVSALALGLVFLVAPLSADAKKPARAGRRAPAAAKAEPAESIGMARTAAPVSTPNPPADVASQADDDEVPGQRRRH